jgi:hypothetical protein
MQYLLPSHPVGMQPNSLLIADLKEMLMHLFLTLFSLARNMHWTAFNFLLLVYFCILIHITLRFALHHETFQLRHFTCRHNHALISILCISCMFTSSVTALSDDSLRWSDLASNGSKALILNSFHSL